MVLRIFKFGAKVILFVFVFLFIQLATIGLGLSDTFDKDWYWSYTVVNKPSERTVTLIDGTLTTLHCMMDWNVISLGGPAPVYKHKGSSNCGTEFWSIPGLIINMVFYGIFFWYLFLRGLSKDKIIPPTSGK